MNENWYNAQPIISHNAILNFIMGGRNIGKTWAFKRRSVRRALKKGKKTIWVRRTIKEASECAETFFGSKDLQEFCGISIYNKESNPQGNIKHLGRRYFIKPGKKWEWFIKIIALCEWKTMRSSDDIDTDTIIFDEFTTTPEKYLQYRGNEARDLIDLSISIMRQHEVKIFLMGNKESVSNPIISYFNIPPMPLKWQGIKLFKKGTIAVQQRNDGVNTQTEFKKRLNTLLSGTDYGDYLQKATYKNQPRVIIKTPPKGVKGWLQLFWRGKHIKLWRDTTAIPQRPEIYVTGTNDLNATIFTDETQKRFKSQIQLQKRLHKKYFRLLEQTVSDNRIAYATYADYENIIAFYAWLGIKN